MMHGAGYILGILLQLTFIATDVRAVGCPPNEYWQNASYFDVPSYGNDCEYRCRCVNDAKCDQNTGDCLEGCAPGWMGPACQYRNVSPLYKAVFQSTTLTNATNAVDGSVATCSDTGVTGSPHWWRVEFHRNFYIVGLKITVLDAQKEHFRKFQVGSTSSTGTIEHVCYQHQDVTGTRIMEVMCRQPVNTSHLVIQLDRTDVALTLCEVDIYGGRLVSFNRITSSDSETKNEGNPPLSWKKKHAVDGLTLLNSTYPNPDKKTCFASGLSKPDDSFWWQVDLGRTYTVQDVNVFARWTEQHAIDVQTKHFTIQLGTSASADHFTPVFYDDPPAVYTAEFYQPRYSDLAIQMDADKVKLSRELSGDRLFLCEVEVFAECPKDTCGWKCTIPCYCEALTTGAYKIDGTCPYGCKPGWKGDGPRCNTECDPGRYGANCAQHCGYCSEGRECDHVTGNCTGDCQAGYQGDRCDTECTDGRYDINCRETCGACRYGSCDKKTGTCSGGCQQGSRGGLCKTPCVDRTYGYNCNETCGNCSGGASCNTTNGHCPGDCDAGFQQPLCKIACKDGKHGVNCGETCGACAEQLGGGNTCDIITGKCPGECRPGWMEDESCKQPCPNSTHGYNCSETCGYCSNNVTCDRQTGECPSGGCEPGYSEGSLCKAVIVIPVPTEEPPTGTANTATIVGVIVAVVVVAAVLVVGVVYWKRRSTNKSASPGGFPKLFPANSRPDPIESPGHIPESGSSTPIKGRTPPAAIGPNSPSDKYISIAVHEVRAACIRALQNVSILHNEYNDLPQGFQHEVNEALKPGNRSKNRYRDMYTYDLNRVVLPIIEDQDTSDYINASLIQGYRTGNAYIASQGTMKNTVTDMWRMIWHKDIRNVVMVTNCVEEGKMKCIQYWPDAGEEVYGNISVTILEETVCAEFTVRRFSCKLLTEDMPREVTQFHYTAWPDKDVPYTELSLVQFWRKVKCSEFAGVTPWLVHCSAGVGRTGTFMALDYLYDQGKDAGEINIHDCVDRLRDQRIKTVQTQYQYVFLYKAAPEVLDPIGAVCKTEEFRQQLTNLRRPGNGPGNSKMHKEYKKMGEDINFALPTTECEYANLSSTPEAYSESSKPGNLKKCRDPLVIPLNDFRVVLPVEGKDNNSFINAVRVSTYTQKNGVILTQLPMASTAGDFVRMLWQYDLSIVVLMDEDVPKDGMYWPDKGMSCTVGPFTAILVQEQKESSYTIRTIRYSKGGKGDTKDVTQFHFQSWPKGNVIPPGKSAILQFLAEVDSAHRSGESDKPMVMQCLNGADRSGLFCALWTVLDRIKAEKEVAIAETVRLLRSRRPQCIPSFEQYEYVYDVVADYLDTLVEYSNV